MRFYCDRHVHLRVRAIVQGSGLPIKIISDNVKIEGTSAVAEQRGEGARGHLYRGANFVRKCMSATPLGPPIYIYIYLAPGGNTPAPSLYS